MTRYLMVGALLIAVACGAGVPQPVAVDPSNDACRQCRMIVSDTRLAGQIVAPGEEPLIFDDIGCLRTYLAATPLAADAAAWVADHRTGQWVPYERAIYTKLATAATPMGSGLVAHRDAQSRDLDPLAHDGIPVDVLAKGAGR